MGLGRSAMSDRPCLAHAIVDVYSRSASVAFLSGMHCGIRYLLPKPLSGHHDITRLGPYWLPVRHRHILQRFFGTLYVVP